MHLKFCLNTVFPLMIGKNCIKQGIKTGFPKFPRVPQVVGQLYGSQYLVACEAMKSENRTVPAVARQACCRACKWD